MKSSLLQRAKAGMSEPGKSPELARAEADYAALRSSVADERTSPTLRYLKQRIQELRARGPQKGQ